MKPKLVRDRIPDMIKERGTTPIIHIADDKEYWVKLKAKLREEVDEFIEDPCEEELADIQEVINAIYDYKDFDKNEVENTRIKKAEERGGFKERIILDGTKEVQP